MTGSYSRATHHASTGKHGIVYRVCGYMCILTIKRNFDNDQVMNVLKVITNGLFGMLWATIQDDQIPCRTDGYLVGNMAR